MTKIEILCPAGSMEAVRAAVLNGADAVYLGHKLFNARQNAENFDDASLKEAVDFCHIHDVKAYLTLNTVMFDDEMEQLEQLVKTACALCVDALIVQDMGVLKLVKACCPEMRVHASTQMTVHTVRGARLLEILGVNRVVLARELTLQEIQEIVQNTELEVEVFVHGALCMSVSGQCYMSAMIGGRSGNKGNCAGTCRLPFRVGEEAGYDLSLKDLCLAQRFDELVKAGVTSLKIEGRMKRPEYVAAAARAYSGLKSGIVPDLEQLRAVFSRSGFTDGYLTGKIDGEMFGFRAKEDVVSATAEVLSSLQETYLKEKPSIPVSMSLTLHDGAPAVLTVSNNKGDFVQVEGACVEQALSKPTTEEMAREALQKLGGTAYFLVKLDADLGTGCMLSKSKLNDLRRMACKELDRKRAARPCVAFHPSAFEPKVSKKIPSSVKLRARFRDCSQIPFELAGLLEYITIPVDQALRYANVLMPLKDKIILEPGRVLFGREGTEAQKLQQLKGKGFTRMSATNPSHVQLGREVGLALFGTAFLNCTNALAVQQYRELGVKEMELSLETGIGKLRTLCPQGRGIGKLGIIGYGSLPLMVARNCPVKQQMDCVSCKGKQGLTDRLGNRFPVTCAAKKYSEVLNCNVMYLADKKEEFDFLDFMTLYFTGETKQECVDIINQYQNGGTPPEQFTRGLYYRALTGRQED